MQFPITSRRILAIIGAVIVCILMCVSFLAGVKTGERRTRHYSNWSQHYPDMMRMHRNERSARPVPGMMMKRVPAPLPNGVFGHVLSVTGTSMIIEGRDHFEQNVLVNEKTTIRNEFGAATTTDIQPNMKVSVFGVPNDQGQIEARLIRLFTR